MTCRQCGAEIAEKAIVCYRCGTPTAAPAAPKTAAPAARARLGALFVASGIVAGAAILGAVWPAYQGPIWVAGVVVAAGLTVAWMAFRRIH
ncbi:MAG TPA: hypothetical protein VLT86_19295 [Vicinamibacterales bacterium]|nr:hypothetical protein [Vicinamibacterales bacterium]